MSRLHDQDTTFAQATSERSWEKPAAADDIVDPIEIGPGGATPSVLPVSRADSFEVEQSEEEQEDVPLDVKLTDALSMLAEGGHDYRSTPLASDPVLDETDLADDRDADNQGFQTVEIDESSKDA